VVVIGLGGVGIHAAQIAAALGARVVGFDVHASTLETARSLGLDARAADGDATGLRDALDSEGAEIAIDAVGTAETVALAAELARPGGRIVAVGHSAGAAGPPLQRVVLEELELVGSRYASLEEMARGVAMVADGSVRPVIGMLRRLEQANEVLDALEAGRVVGRAVVEVGQRPRRDRVATAWVTAWVTASRSRRRSGRTAGPSRRGLPPPARRSCAGAPRPNPR
jgi:D-arabinose 1-dehydrogenase-like Zn-dependent alcohol dehydrogenase